MAIVVIGVLDHLPQELIISLLGKPGSRRDIVRAAIAGVLRDLCSHGILMIGSRLYQRGASAGQVMAFLITSPWNSVSLTLILISLIGLGWTLAFIALSAAVAPPRSSARFSTWTCSLPGLVQPCWAWVPRWWQQAYSKSARRDRCRLALI